jgi:hypothetical protein
MVGRQRTHGVVQRREAGMARLVRVLPTGSAQQRRRQLVHTPVRCGAVRCHAVHSSGGVNWCTHRCGAARCGAVPCTAAEASTGAHTGAVRRGAVPCRAQQRRRQLVHSPVRCGAVRCHAVHSSGGVNWCTHQPQAGPCRAGPSGCSNSPWYSRAHVAAAVQPLL